MFESFWAWKHNRLDTFDVLGDDFLLWKYLSLFDLVNLSAQYEGGIKIGCLVLRDDTLIFGEVWLI